MASFGFDQATSVAAWTAVTLITLPLGLLSSKAAVMQLASPMTPRYMPILGVIFSMWMIIGAAWVVAMYYLTSISGGDSWQLIAGVVFFLVHAVLVKLGNVFFWKLHYPRTAFSLTFIAFLCVIGLICCSFINQTNSNYLIPGIIFIVYAVFLFLHMWSNSYYFKMRKHSRKHQSNPRDEFDYQQPQEENDQIVHYSGRRNY